MNFREYENSLPKKIVLERECHGAKLPNCSWIITIRTWDRKKYEGTLKDEDVRRILKGYQNFWGYEKFKLVK